MWKLTNLRLAVTQQSGQLLIEVLIVFGVLVITLPALFAAIMTSRDGSAQQEKRLQAIGLYRETFEAIRVIRETDWNIFAVNGTYHPVQTGKSWQLATGVESINSFTRRVIIADAYRDSSGVLVNSGGTLDPSTKKVSVTISWTQPSVGQLDTEVYMTRYLDNLTVTHTTEAEFNLGTLLGTTITNTTGGEVTLGGGGSGSWCKPFESQATQLDLPKNGEANAISAIEGRIYAGTGANASGVSFANVSVTNTQPPSVSIAGTLDGYKTNDVFAETNYAYIATDTNSEEIVIISTTATPYAKVGYVDLPGTTDASAVVTSGQIGYAIAGNKLYNYDLSSKNGNRSLMDTDGVVLPGEGTSLEVVGNYAYVSIAGSSTKLQIVEVSTPTNLQLRGSASVNSQSATDVSVNQTGTRAYLATAESSTQREVFVIDTFTKTGNLSTVGSYETNGMSPRTISFVTGNIVIVAGTGAEEYQVLNVSNESLPIRCGGIEIDAGVNELAAILETDGDAYSYVLTGVSNNELRVFQGGPGGQYANSGTFESSIFDAGYTTAFNYVIATLVVPNQTTARFQVAVADAVNGSCTATTYFFVGPDGTSNTFYTSEGPLVLNDDDAGYENPGRCFKYKVFLETNDFGSTPVMEDFLINYSP